MYNIITIGDAVTDTHVMIDDAAVECDPQKHCRLCFDFGQKIPVTDSFQSLGGNAANVALGAARLGLRSAIITSVGKDAGGKFVFSELKKNKIDCSLSEQDARFSTRYSIVLNFKGERTILSYHGRREYAWPKKLPTTEWIYYTSLSEGFENLEDNLLAFLKKNPSVRLAINPGSYQLKNCPERVRAMLGHTDILILNLEEAEKIAGTTLAKEKSIAGLINRLLSLGAKEIAITDGGRGAWAGNEKNVWHLESFPVKVVAKTGAGDAFSAGYVAARSQGLEIATAMSWGIANSCGVIGELGPHKGLLDEKGIKKMLANFASIKPQKV